MKRAFHLIAVVGWSLLIGAACDSSRGRPKPEDEVKPPDEVVNFKLLYSQNCSGCHGTDGRGGGAEALSDPLYLAIADDQSIRRTISMGVSGTPMPAFGIQAGGMLTDKQINALVSGVRTWAKPNVFRDMSVPSYPEQNSGDPRRGAEAFRQYCSSCHGIDGRGGKASSIVDAAYLELVSNQNLRTNVIVGRPDMGAPDWRGDVPGNPMTEQDVSDIVAWLAEHRAAESAVRYGNSSTVTETGESQ